MTDQEILDGAPDKKWSHFTGDGNYLLNDDGHFYYWNDFSEEWASCRGIKLIDVRSREDIQALVDKDKDNKGLQLRINKQKEVISRQDNRSAELERKIKSARTILTIAKLNPLHSRETQLRRALNALGALDD